MSQTLPLHGPLGHEALNVKGNKGPRFFCVFRTEKKGFAAGYRSLVSTVRLPIGSMESMVLVY